MRERERDGPIKVQDVCKIPTKQDQERNSPGDFVIKTLNVQNKRKILKTARRKPKAHIKTALLELHLTS